jgi:hypothetical protein
VAPQESIKEARIQEKAATVLSTLVTYCETDRGRMSCLRRGTNWEVDYHSGDEESRIRRLRCRLYNMENNALHGVEGTHGPSRERPNRDSLLLCYMMIKYTVHRPRSIPRDRLLFHCPCPGGLPDTLDFPWGQPKFKWCLTRNNLDDDYGVHPVMPFMTGRCSDRHVVVQGLRDLI